jgi:hypothetical protein
MHLWASEGVLVIFWGLGLKRTSDVTIPACFRQKRACTLYNISIIIKSSNAKS